MTEYGIPRSIYNDDHQMFREAARKFFEREVVPYHQKWEEEGIVPREVWRKAGEAGFLCATMPEEYGGSGVDRRYSAILMEEQAYTGCSGPGFSLHSDIRSEEHTSELQSRENLV